MPHTVLHLIFTDQVAGAERHVGELTCALRERNWRCLIACGPGLETPLRDLYTANAELHVLGGSDLGSMSREVRAIARSHGVDVIHAHMGSALQVATMAHPVGGPPLVTTIHFVHLAHASGRMAAIKSRIYRVATRRAARVITVSDAVRAMVERTGLANPERIDVVHNGVGCLVADPPLVPVGDRPVVLYGGRLEREKQLDVLIRALAATSPTVELWVAGRGSEEKGLRSLADRMLPARTRFFGFVPNLAPLIDGARVVAVPSIGEGFGIIAVDAMRRARPVVGFASGGLPEVVDDGTTGLLAAPGDEAQLGTHISRLLDDRGLATTMGAAGRAKYEQSFTASTMAAATELVYLKAMQRS